MTGPAHVAQPRAVYDATALRYADVIGTRISAAVEAALDRAVLDAFVEWLRAAPGPVADVGCGPGRVAAFLAAEGLRPIGVDAAPAMLAVARRAHPGIPFVEALLCDLPVADGSLAGAVCWYSIIHTPPDRLGPAFTGLARAVRVGGPVLLGFQAGEGEAVRRPDAYGTGVPLTSYRHDPDQVARALVASGFRPSARVLREPELDHESTPQAFVVGHRER